MNRAEHAGLRAQVDHADPLAAAESIIAREKRRGIISSAPTPCSSLAPECRPSSTAHDQLMIEIAAIDHD
jgi:hypothetical protein